MAEPLALIRALHFGASLLLTGGWVFMFIIARPVFSHSGREMKTAHKVFNRWWLGLMGWSLLACFASGLLWLGAEAIAMSGLAWSRALTGDIIGAVLTGTQFGRIWELRAVLIVLLAGCLALRRHALATPWLSVLDFGAGLLSGSLLASLAWIGHAVGAEGGERWLHLAMDAVHLLAAAAWLGALVPLGFILAQARRSPAPVWIDLARHIIPRFSILGLVSVGSLIVTGLANAYSTVGDSAHLLATSYGRLLLLKLGLFGLMLVIAADNRLRLTPQLLATVGQDNAGFQPNTVGRLRRNVMMEIGLEAAILFIVGALGIMHPAVHISQ